MRLKTRKDEGAWEVSNMKHALSTREGKTPGVDVASAKSVKINKTAKGYRLAVE
jgi:hypothetical protein